MTASPDESSRAPGPLARGTCDAATLRTAGGAVVQPRPAGPGGGVPETQRGDIAELASIFDGLGHGLVGFDQEERCATASETAAGMVGLQPSDLLGHPVADLARRLRVRIRSAGQGAAPSGWDRAFSVRAWRPDGRAVILRGIPLPPGDQRMFVVRDATAQRRAAVALRRAQAQAEALAAALAARTPDTLQEGFVALLAHEMRNPLAALQISVAAAARLLPPAGTAPTMDDAQRARRLVQQIDRQAGRLTGLVEQLLESGRIGTGRPALNPRGIDLVVLCREALRDAASRDRDHRYRLSPGLAAVTVRADPARLWQVLGHLLSNARKYSPLGTPIVVHITREAGRVAVSITDSGLGVPEGDRDRIFEPFFRGANVRGPDGPPGLGLGLYICRALLRQHGGDIAAGARSDGGTRVRFTLPLSEGETA